MFKCRLEHVTWRGVSHTHLIHARQRAYLKSPAFQCPALLSLVRGGGRDLADPGSCHPVVRGPGRPDRTGSARSRPLPLARAEAAPSVRDDVMYGIGRIDASGRISDRTVTQALGWSGSDRLTLTADAGVITARRDPGGMITLPARAYIAIPAALRRRCGLRPGDRVLLAAAPAEDTLTAYSLAVVDQAVRAHRASQHVQGEQP